MPAQLVEVPQPAVGQYAGEVGAVRPGQLGAPAVRHLGMAAAGEHEHLARGGLLPECPVEVVLEVADRSRQVVTERAGRRWWPRVRKGAKWVGARHDGNVGPVAVDTAHGVDERGTPQAGSPCGQGVVLHRLPFEGPPAPSGGGVGHEPMTQQSNKSEHMARSAQHPARRRCGTCVSALLQRVLTDRSQNRSVSAAVTLGREWPVPLRPVYFASIGRAKPGVRRRQRPTEGAVDVGSWIRRPPHVYRCSAAAARRTTLAALPVLERRTTL